jgi:hypothetical protein
VSDGVVLAWCSDRYRLHAVIPNALEMRLRGVAPSYVLGRPVWGGDLEVCPADHEKSDLFIVCDDPVILSAWRLGGMEAALTIAHPGIIDELTRVVNPAKVGR